MDPTRIRSLLSHRGPFATVYLQGRPVDQDAPHQLQVRWDSLRDRLRRAGAPDPLVAVLDQALVGPGMAATQGHGRVLVASGDGLLLDEPWGGIPGGADTATWADTADVGDHLRAELRTVRAVVGVVDQTGARIHRDLLSPEHTAQDGSDQTVSAAAVGGVHKPRKGSLSHKNIQRHSDERVRQNAEEIADALRNAAKDFHADLVVLAGGVEGRTATREALGEDVPGRLVEVAAGGDDDAAAEAALDAELRRLAGEETDRRVADQNDLLGRARGHGLAVQGSAAVAHAAEMGAVGTLLLHEDTRALDEAGLIAVCVREGADVGLIDVPADDSVAAILRFRPRDQSGR